MILSWSWKEADLYVQMADDFMNRDTNEMKHD